ncbi:MAG: hypothetical protein ACRDD7_12475 [Peptostreptococcaceae bacterium]
MNKNNLNNEFLEVPERFKNRLRITLNNLPEKEVIYKSESKRTSILTLFNKKAIVTVASIFVLSTTAYAFSKINSQVSYSSNIPTYTSIPSKEILNKDVGYSPKVVDEFENGYKFKGGYISKNQGLDESNEVVEESDGVFFEYDKNNKKIMISTEEKVIGEIGKSEQIVQSYKDIDLYYSEDSYKFVPEDYEMTEQDKKDEASGKYVFSYGSEEVEISKNQFLCWVDNDNYYSILATDSDLSKDDLLKMSKEIIDEI